MGNFQVSAQNVQVTVETRVTASRRQPEPQPVAAPQPTSLDRADAIEIKSSSSPIEIAKKMGGGILLGGGIAAVAQSAVTSMATESLRGPSVAGTSLGVALGAGIGLLNIETGDKNLNVVKNTIGGALMGGSILGMVAASVSTIAAERLMPASPIAIGMGAAIGAGIALLDSEH